jgi:hypothetical protein
MPGAPERYANALIEHPADGQLDHPLMKVIPRELIELLNRCEVLPESRRLELRINAPQIITFEGSVRPHSAAQEPATQRSVSKSNYIIRATVGENIILHGSLEKVVWGLQYMQRRNPTEALHFRDREIADADGADLSFFVKRAHHLCSFLDGHERIGPMNLIDVDVIRAQPSE